MSTKVPDNPNPFTDPNAALRMFNEYFGNLRNQYGEDVVRQVGFTPKEFQDLQAKLRNLQTDRSATPEQHREAYMQARDTLARRLTTPLEATRSYSMVQQPKPAPSPPVANDGTMPLVTPKTVMPLDMKSPTQEQLYSYARAVGRGETGQWDPVAGAFLMTAQPPQPQQGGLTQAQQPVMPPPPMPQGVGGMELPVANTGGNIAPRTVPHDYDPAAQYRNFGQQLLGLIKSGAMTVEQANALKAPVFDAVKLGNSAEGYQQMQNALGAASQPIRNALVAGGQQMGGQNTGATGTPVMPPPEREVIGLRSPVPGVHGGDTRIFADQPVPQPVTRQPFDPNAALQTFNNRAAELNASGKGLFASGMVPDEFRMYQGILRNLQLNPNSTPEQHADILNKSMAFLNQYSGATPQPMVDPNVPYRPTGPDVFNPDGTPVVMKPKGIGGMPPQGSPNALTIARGPIPLDQQGPPLGGGIGAFLGRQGGAPQGGGMPPGVGMLRDQMAAMLNPQPRQGSFVNTMPMAQADPNFRFGETTQQMPQNAQAMALGGLMAKYRGGMC